MENASKALLMAGGILIGILIITLMITLFASSGQVASTYEKEKQSEAVQQFNTNFTKYLGRELTIHEVVTICNFAYGNNTYKVEVNGYTNNPYQSDNIKDDLGVNQKYKLTLPVNAYNSNGYITKINISNNP